MSSRAKRIILLIVAAQVVLAIGIFTLPRAVQALPGRYVARLQNHPVTAGIVELVTTPIPEALPAPAGAVSQAGTGDNDPRDIPGLDENLPTRPAATATPTPNPTATPRPTNAPTEVPPTATPTITPSPTPEPLPTQVVLEGLSVVAQDFNNCGPANLSIALNYHGNETTQEEAASYLKPNQEDRNVSPWQISDYVNEFTALRSAVHSGGNMEMIKQFIANDLPVVIEKGYEPANATGWYGHYLTVYGYDDEEGVFYSRDTNLGPFDGSPRIDDYEEFEQWWQQFNYTFYVVYEPSQETLVTSIIPDVLETDESMWQYTAELAQNEIDADPDNVFAWFNLGVSLTRLGELSGNQEYYQAGAQAFDEAREIGLPTRTLYYEHRPFMAYYKTGRLDDVLELTDAMLATTGGPYVEEIYWYRGHALASQGDVLGACTAYENALEVNPNFYYAEWSADSLSCR